MAGDRNAQIRERAYLLWENEGRPAGRDMEFWLQAEAACDARPERRMTTRESPAIVARPRDQASRKQHPAKSPVPAKARAKRSANGQAVSVKA
jgi:hypothetical protein